MRKINAITLAAGYGTRLRPITDVVPKPLVPIGDRPLLDIIFANLAAAGVAEIAVNTHHLSEILETAIRESRWSDRVSINREEEILGTGGPVVAARALLSDADAFILHNGDILTDADLAELAAAHFAADGAAVTMLLIDGPENKVSVAADGQVIDILGKLGQADREAHSLTYAGIAVFSPQIFDYLPSNPVNCSIITAILDLAREYPDAIRSHIPEKINWNDLGTVERFIAARRAVETGELKLPPVFGDGPPVRAPLSPLPLQGSDRLFIRLEHAGENGDSAIAMCAPGDKENFARFATIGKFLHSLNLGVPEISEISEENQTLVMEDLGDDTLLSLSAKLARGALVNRYEKALKWLIKFQSKTFGTIVDEKSYGADSSDLLPLRLFDIDYLLWESSYFADNYLVRLSGVRESELKPLRREFRELAELALSHPQVMIHRDFQSSNILFKDGIVRIVDFQGARIGHIAYDLVALLKDPYVSLPEKTRGKLFKRHFEFFRDSRLPDILERRFQTADN
ncbi:MAG: NTP transferase domain-containing protein, partial [Kiritimatiellaeota bacterium]|nr:NTP transferase domain-containing protein [Kiritimatiellota bacterium]